MVQRYGFVNFPKTAEQMLNNEVKFENGMFTGLAGELISVGLTIYKNGLVADTRSSTDDSDFFLNNLLMWLHDEYGFLEQEEVMPKRIYLSELYITCEQSPKYFSQELADFRSELSHHDFGHGVCPIEITGLFLGPDPQHTNLRSYHLTFERVLHIPFASNNYFSSAPFRTEAHLAILNKLEKTLSELREAF